MVSGSVGSLHVYRDMHDTHAALNYTHVAVTGRSKTGLFRLVINALLKSLQMLCYE